MKKTFKIFALLLAGTMFVACDKGNEGGGGNGGGDGDKDYPPGVVVEKMFSGEIKAGYPDQIEIVGSGFDPVADYIFVGYTDENGKLQTERVSPEVLTLLSKRISFGVNVGAGYIDKTCKVYLDRGDEYALMPISGELTFKLPEVSEGYIPDPAFRATLMSDHPQQGNPNIKTLFSPLGMIDPVAAASVERCGVEGYGLNLYACAATSLEGIELFTGLTGAVAAWDMPNIKEIDLSNWKIRGVGFHSERAASLEKFVGPPYARRIILNDCPKLTYVDVHDCNWLSALDLSSAPKDKPSSVTYLDMRRNNSGNFNSNPTKDDEFIIWGGDSYLKLAEGATVKIDSWFLFDHNIGDGNGDSCWKDLYDSWKERNVTIEVYSRVDPYRDQLIGTVPSYKEDPDALSPNNKISSLNPSNKWQVDDPNTPEDEAPVPYVPPGK